MESRGNTRPDDSSDRYLMSDCPMGGVWRWRREQEDVGEGSNNEDGGWAREGEFKVTGTGGLNGPRGRGLLPRLRGPGRNQQCIARVGFGGDMTTPGCQYIGMAGDADLFVQ